MTEVIFAQSTELDVAYRIATPVGNPDYFLNLEFAETIDTLQTAVGSEDKQAHVIADLFRSGTISHGNKDHAVVAFDSIHRAEELRLKVAAAEQAGVVPPTSADTLSDILDSFEDVKTIFVNRVGLVGVISGGKDGFIVYHDTDIEGSFRAGSTEDKIAKKLALDRYVWNQELVWEDDHNGTPRPYLLSDKTHATLGTLCLAGGFKPIVSILSPDHPATIITRSRSTPW